MEPSKKLFDFEAFPKQAAEDLKAGKPMVGKDGVFTPLLKQLLIEHYRILLLVMFLHKMTLFYILLHISHPQLKIAFYQIIRNIQ